MRARRLTIAVAFLLATIGIRAGLASATRLESAIIETQVQKDGSLLVAEQITMSDVFHGGYRDIPMREGESIDSVSVWEGERKYRYGGSTELGSIGEPDTYATTSRDNVLRVVWHFDNPSGGPRTFTVSYRFRGLSVAYDDVVDVNLQVWGKG